MPNHKSFRDKVALITGGASGIGHELGEKLRAAGARVHLADLRPGDGIEVLDVRDRQAVADWVGRVADEEGRIDLLFNNAGIGVVGEVRDYAYDDWRRVIDVNLFGVINGIDAAYPIMVRQGSGHIVNVSSIAGLCPFPAEVSYTASKYAVVGLSRALRVEAAPLGVKVTVVCPGLIDTPILDNIGYVGVDAARLRSLLPSGAPADKCADAILCGVRRNRQTVLVTVQARVLDLAERLSPKLTEWLFGLFMRRLRRIRTGNTR